MWWELFWQKGRETHVFASGLETVRAFCMFLDLPVFMLLSKPEALCFSLDVAHVDYGCVLRWMILFCVSFCFLCYMFCAVFLWSLLPRGIGAGWGILQTCL